METHYLYTIDSFDLKYMELNVCLKIEAENWDKAEIKAKSFCKNNGFTLAWGYSSIFPKFGVIIININNPKWKDKYFNTISKLVARRI